MYTYFSYPLLTTQGAANLARDDFPSPSKEQSEALSSLQAAMAHARYDHLFTLVESIDYAKRQGVDATAAEALLKQLSAHKASADTCMTAVHEATKSKNLVAIAAALKRGEDLGLTRELDSSRAIFSSLQLAAAEDDLLLEVRRATVSTLPELSAAIDRAKARHVGVARIVDAQAVALTLRKRKGEMEECLTNLATACRLRSVARIESTLASALQLGLPEDHEQCVEARAVLAQIVSENVEAEVRRELRSATSSNFQGLSAAIAAAAVLGFTPHTSPALASAVTRLRDLNALNAKRAAVLSRLAHAVDMEVADELEAALLETEHPGGG